jgi:hypothetical protein
MSDDTGQPGEPAEPGEPGEPLRWPRDSKAEDFEVPSGRVDRRRSGRSSCSVRCSASSMRRSGAALARPAPVGPPCGECSTEPA